MIREKVTVNDFQRITKENEYFLWHFLMEDQHDSALALWSIFETKDKHHFGYDPSKQLNQLDVLLSEVNIPYFESHVKDSIDFLANLGLSVKSLYRPTNDGRPIPKRWFYQPIVIAFKRTRMITNTHRTCYCIDGITEIILKLDPNLLNNLV